MTDYAGFWIGLFAFFAVMITMNGGACGQPNISQGVIYKLTAVKNWEYEHCNHSNDEKPHD